MKIKSWFNRELRVGGYVSTNGTTLLLFSLFVLLTGIISSAFADISFRGDSVFESKVVFDNGGYIRAENESICIFNATHSMMSCWSQETTTISNSSLILGGHIKYTGGSPVVSSCGAGGSVKGSDTKGTITVGTGLITSCVLTFNNTPVKWVEPSCNANSNNAGITVGIISLSNTSMTFGLSLSLGGGKIYYDCGEIG